MGRILAFDFGKKRTGIAATDPLQIIASGLTTVNTNEVFSFLTNYLKSEQVECFVVGFPTQLENTKPSHSAPLIKNFVKQLKKKFPDIPVELEDENYTSKLAMQAMIDGGLKKMQRRDKAMVDKVSAAIILQSFMSRTKN